MNLPPGYVPMVRQPMMVPVAMPVPGMQSAIGHPGIQPVIAGMPHQVSTAQHPAIMAQHPAVIASQQLQLAGHSLPAQHGLVGTFPPHLQAHPTLVSPSYAAALQANQLSTQAGLLGSLQPQAHQGLMSPLQQAYQHALSPYSASPLAAQSSLLIGSPMHTRIPIQSPLAPQQVLTAEQVQAMQDNQLSMLDPSVYQMVEGGQVLQATPKSKAEMEAEVKPFVLDDFNSDLNLLIADDGYGAHALTIPDGFCFCWAGVRATQGATRGKVYYEVHITEHLPVTFPSDHQETDPHIVRVGWSIDSASLQLGEEEYSYGYGGTGKFSVKSKFTDYGNRFCAGDVIGALLDLESKPPNISFMKNGKWLTVAHNLRGFPVGQADMALYPHILSKNCRFKVNFGQMAAWFAPPPGFTFIQQTPAAHRVVGRQPPKLISDCEIIMIVGLPGAGKTTWANKTKKDNPDKRYNIIGTDTLIDRMRVNGLARKRNYAGRWDVLIDKATKCLNKLFVLGSKRCRNYILDQTNVYPTAQQRKMKHFRGFKRRAAVLVTEDKELVTRSKKRTDEDGKVVPNSAVLEMKMNFKLPEKDGISFDEIFFIELPHDRAAQLVNQYNLEGRMSLSPSAQKSMGNQQQSMRPPYGVYQPRQPPGIVWNNPQQHYPTNSTALDSIKKEYTSGQDDWQTMQSSTYQAYPGYRLPSQNQYTGIPLKPEPASVISTWSASQDWQAKPQITPRMYPATKTSTNQSWNQWPEGKEQQSQRGGIQSSIHGSVPARSQTLTTINTSGDMSTSQKKQTRSPSPAQNDDPTRKRVRRSKWDTADEADSTDKVADIKPDDIDKHAAGESVPDVSLTQTTEIADNKMNVEPVYGVDEQSDSNDWFKKENSDCGEEHKLDQTVMDKCNSIRQADSTTDSGNFHSYMRGRGSMFRGRPPFRNGPHDMRFRPFGPMRGFPPHGPMDRFGPPPRRGFMPRFGLPPMGGGPPRFPPRMGPPRYPRPLGPRGPMR